MIILYYMADDIQTAIAIAEISFALTHKACALLGGTATLQLFVEQYKQLAVYVVQYSLSTTLISEAHFLSNTP